jgi:RecJ-like exonuclease
MEKLLETCEHCDGKGFIYDPICDVCGERVKDAGFAVDNRKMPCGHDWFDVTEEHWCIECEGTGKAPTDAGRELVKFMRWYDQAG